MRWKVFFAASAALLAAPGDGIVIMKDKIAILSSRKAEKASASKRFSGPKQGFARLEWEGKSGDVYAHGGDIELRSTEVHGQPQLDGWSNMLIQGDNLAVLRDLLDNPSIGKKVTLVYIDPPFGTNQEFRGGSSRTISRSPDDEIAYTDTLVGADYLQFLFIRLKLLREMLSESGSIYLHLDWKMGHYAKMLMDEAFGQDMFINNITRIKSNPKSFKRRAYGNMTDMILFYSNTGNHVWNDAREEVSEEDLDKLFPKVDADGRRYTTLPLHAPGETRHGPTGKPWKGVKPPKGSHWQYRPEELDRLDEAGLIEWSSTGNPRRKHYADDLREKGKKRQDIWEFKDPFYPTYPTEKNLDMLKMIIETSSNPGDIVLDCFSGSGATLIAAEMTGRRWIGIDVSEAAIEAAKKRLLSLEKEPSFTIYEARQIRKQKAVGGSAP